MSLFYKTSEEYYAARDAFVAYIETEVNPAREAAGLSLIREHEARECFRIIEEFSDRWMGRTTSTVNSVQGECRIDAALGVATSQPNAARKTVWKPYDVFGVTGRLVYEDTGEDVPDQPPAKDE